MKQSAAAITPATFTKRVLRWFKDNGRHDLPWQQNPTAYRVWVSEIMLQQTQVATVIPYYHRFMERFPDLEALAKAEQDQVLHLWTGLGYYARGRNLHKAAQTVITQHSGKFPTSVEALCDLPGIGRSTAGAIAAIAMAKKAAILDGNVKRVLTRHFAVAGWPEQNQIKQQLWQVAEDLTQSVSTNKIAHYTQAMMDLGATLCTRSKPQCNSCPLKQSCQAKLTDTIALYPGKKPRKVLPVKTVALFILQNSQGEVLLQKRPSTGIWGGLWSFPEGDDHKQLPQLNHLQLKHQTSDKWSKLPPLRHSFSHYHLDISPILVKVEDKTQAVMEANNWLWYPLDQSVEVGLAAPVKKLLSTLETTKTGT